MTTNALALATRLTAEADFLSDHGTRRSEQTDDLYDAAALLAAPLDRETLARALYAATCAEREVIAFDPWPGGVRNEWLKRADAVLARLAAKGDK